MELCPQQGRAWVNSYSLSHTISRELSRRQVSIYEIKSHLGHKPQDLDITSVYTPYNPTYLKAAAEGIDDYFDDLRAVCVPISEFLEIFPTLEFFEKSRKLNDIKG